MNAMKRFQAPRPAVSAALVLRTLGNSHRAAIEAGVAIQDCDGVFITLRCQWNRAGAAR